MKIKSIMDAGYRFNNKKELEKKAVSEDNCFFSFDNKERASKFVAVVCDGIGSMKGSEKASKFVTDKIAEYISDNENLKEMEYNEFLRDVEDLILKIHNDEFWDKVGKRIGTTMTVLFLTSEKYVTLNVGDSRVYLIKQNPKTKKSEIMQITEDDVDKESNKITQCIGKNVKKDINIAIKDGDLPTHCTFIVCSDGLYKTVSNEEILLNVCAENRKLENLVKIARQNKEMDDITFVYIER